MNQSAPVNVAVGRASPGALLELLKPITWFPPMWAFLCGWVSAGPNSSITTWSLLAGIALTGPLVCGASQVVNDWYDRDVDALNEPHRPIPSGRVPGKTALSFAMVWTLIAQTWAMMLGTWVAAATFIGLLLAWAYSAPPLRLKLNGWWGNSAVALSYEGLAWVTGAAIVMGGALPSAPTLIIALLYSIGAHGIMTLNDFKSVEGDLKLGIRSLPAQLGRECAASIACGFMLLPQLVVIALLMAWQLNLSAGTVAIVVGAQLLCMKRLLSDPKRFAPWYNATGVSLYVLGMMSAALGLGGWLA
ncbi:MAG: bacteriochlorophyll/chlorophyll synthetase [Halieaceae bacterium]|nr:bacteriochlorophyll/chlorophyll synthetase [Halieaceae bacterium]